MADHQKILILDFGGQYTQLIARRVRENHVYSEVVPWSISASEIAARQPVGIILSGGPASVCDLDAPHCDPAAYDLGVPVLGHLLHPLLRWWTLELLPCPGCCK